MDNEGEEHQGYDDDDVNDDVNGEGNDADCDDDNLI